MTQTRPYPEIIFGIVGPLGLDMEMIETMLSSCLEDVGYYPQRIKLTDALRALRVPEAYKLPLRSEDSYYDKAMDLGNYCREIMGKDFMAALGIEAIRHKRKAETHQRRAFIISSLKRPEEVKLLKKVYGRAAVILSLHSPRRERVKRFAGQLADIKHQHRADHLRGTAERLIKRDEEEEEKPCGQRLRRTFPLADFFLRDEGQVRLKHEVTRFVELFFGNLWITPSIDEQGMALAYLARVRSASAGRQVGAAILDSRGNVVSIGTNEVAKPHGGQYWEGDSPDGRDHNYDKADLSDRMRRHLLGDLLDRLKRAGHLSNEFPAMNTLLSGTPPNGDSKLVRDALLFDTIDFVRAVHAEAAAILSAQRPFGSAGETLYVTTFPCHECARHIVVSGIGRVIYIEPYPKSLVAELYSDSIIVDDDCGENFVKFQQFEGIAPTLYQDLFTLGDRVRKEDGGVFSKWKKEDAFPQLLHSYSEVATRTAEKEVLDNFNQRLEKGGFVDGSQRSAV